MSEEQGPEDSRVESMTDQPDRPEQTGHRVVDDVLASLEGLDGLPPVDQVPVFESAHERLRSALAGAGNEHPV